MNVNGHSLLKRLKNAHWAVAARTYGNDHSALIGLLVYWWISMSPNNHWALEGGPTNGYKQKGVRGQCDALLCDRAGPIGVLEVEGTRHESTVRKIGKFFNAKIKDYESLKFGILLLYTYQAIGCGENRRFPEAAVPEALNEVIGVTEKHQDKSFIVITLDKEYQHLTVGIRARNEYYMGKPNSIEGRLYIKGKEREKISFYKKNPN